MCSPEPELTHVFEIGFCKIQLVSEVVNPSQGVGGACLAAAVGNADSGWSQDVLLGFFVIRGGHGGGLLATAGQAKPSR